MFGKHKKQKSKTPIEEMEQFYLNQFLNNTKNPPQGYNGMSPLGPSFNQMMGPNTSAGPQFQGRNGGMTSIGGLNSMMNNNFNPAQMPMANNNMNPNQPSMMNNPYPTMNTNPMMSNNPNPNYYPMMDNTYPQPQMMNNGTNAPYSMMNNNLNSNQMPMINNGGNPNSYPIANNPFNPNSMVNNNPYSMTTNNYNPNQVPNYGPNTNPYQMTNNNYNQLPQPSLINENLSANIGAEPSGNESFPGQFSFNDFSYSPTPQDALPDLTPSLEDLTRTNILSNQYFRPNPYSAGSDVQQDIQDNTSKTTYKHPSLTPTNAVGASNPNIATYSVDPAVPSPPPPTNAIMAAGQGYANNQMPAAMNPSANYSMTNTANVDVFDVKNKVDNINIRLRKVESYLGFRPETTI